MPRPFILWVILLTVGGCVGWLLSERVLAAFAVAGFLLLLTLRLRQILVLLVLSTFFSGVLMPIGIADIRIEHTIMLVAIVAAAIQIHRPVGIQRLRLLRDDRLVLLSIFGLIGWNVVVSILRSPDLATSMRMAGWLTLNACIYWILRAGMGRDGSVTVARLAVMGSGLMGVASVMVWAYATLGYTGWGVQWDYATRSYVPKLFAYESNILGSTLALWVIVGLALVSHHSQSLSKAWRRTTVWSTGLAAAGVVATLSRGATAGLLVGLIILVLRGKANWLKGLLVVVAAALVVSSAGLSPAAFGPARDLTTKMVQITNFDTGTGRVRLHAWQDALGDLDTTGAAFGLGLNSFGARHQWITGTGEGYISNLPLQIVYDGGLVALLLFVCFLYVVIKKDGAGHDRSFRLAWAATFLVASAATNALWIGSTWVTLAILMSEDRPEARFRLRH